jgi:hypothetical protein
VTWGFYILAGLALLALASLVIAIVFKVTHAEGWDFKDEWGNLLIGVFVFLALFAVGGYYAVNFLTEQTVNSNATAIHNWAAENYSIDMSSSNAKKLEDVTSIPRPQVSVNYEGKTVDVVLEKANGKYELLSNGSALKLNKPASVS